MYADTQLPAAYTVFGHLDEASTETVADAGNADGGPDGAPKTPVDIKAVTQN